MGGVAYIDKRRWEAIVALVNKQAADEGLWFEAETCAEATVQQALRKLHAAIEDRSPEECAIEVLTRICHGR